MNIKKGDILTRLLGGQIPLKVIVGEIIDNTIKVGSADGKVPYKLGWTFCKKTGMEIDEDLNSGPDYGICISYIKEITDETDRKN